MLNSFLTLYIFHIFSDKEALLDPWALHGTDRYINSYTKRTNTRTHVHTHGRTHDSYTHIHILDHSHRNSNIYIRKEFKKKTG